MQLQCKQPVEFVRSQVIAVDELAVEPIIRKRIAREHALCTGELEDMFECDQVDPHGIGAARRALSQVGVESGDEFRIDLRERDVGSAVTFPNKEFQVVMHAPIFIIGMDASVYADHTMKPGIVEGEKRKQIVFRTVPSQELLLDHGGGNQGEAVEESLVACFQMDTQLFQSSVRHCGLVRLSVQSSFPPIPERGVCLEVRGQMRTLAVDGNSDHDGRQTATQRGVSLQVKEDAECISH